jgi:hypothetical protein
VANITRKLRFIHNTIRWDAKPVSHSGESGQSYTATITYTYQIYRSAPKATRVEAQEATADIPTETEDGKYIDIHLGLVVYGWSERTKGKK